MYFLNLNISRFLESDILCLCVSVKGRNMTERVQDGFGAQERSTTVINIISGALEHHKSI